MERLDAGLGVPGSVFGGQATDDPRRVTCVAWSEHLSAESDDESVSAIDRAAAELELAVIACGGVPGWDWSTIRLLSAGGVEPSLHLPLVAVARLLGWSAHVLEQSGPPAASVSRRRILIHTRFRSSQPAGRAPGRRRLWFALDVSIAIEGLSHSHRSIG